MKNPIKKVEKSQKVFTECRKKVTIKTSSDIKEQEPIEKMNKYQIEFLKIGLKMQNPSMTSIKKNNQEGTDDVSN